MVKKFHGKVRGKGRVNFLALLPKKATSSCVVPSYLSELFVRIFA